LTPVRRIALILLLLMAAFSAHAQQGYDPQNKAKVSLYGTNEYPGDTPIPADPTGQHVVCVSGCAGASLPSVGGNASLSVSVASGNVAFPASSSGFPAALLANDGGVDLFYALGNSGVTAATSSAALLPGNQICVAIGTATNVAAITSTSTATLQVTQLSGCPSISGGPLPPSGGSVTVTNFPASQAVSGTFWQATQPISAASLPLPTGAALETGGNLAILAGGVTGAKYQIRPLTSADVVSITGASTPGDAVANPTSAALVESLVEGWDATNTVWRRLQVDAATGTLKVDPGTVTATVSGTVTANAGTNLNTSALALETGGNLATLAGGVTGAKYQIRALTSADIVAITGGSTPGDAVANPTTAALVESLLEGWDATNSVWRRLQVDAATGTLKVDGSGSTQPVSGTVVLGAGAAAVGSVSVSNFPSTQAVSGTVAATQSTSPWVTSDNHLPASAALSDALANPTTSELAANSLGWDATNSVWRRLQVDAGTGTLKVDGSGATQPVSGTVTTTPPANASTNVAQVNGVTVLTGAGAVGTGSARIAVGQDTTTIAGSAPGTAGTPSANVVTVQGSGSGTALPVSGTVTGNQGTANTLANAWAAKITDATNGPAAVKAASTAAAATDPSLVVALSPNYSAITPVQTSTAAATLVLKASAGSLFSVNATNQTTTAGFLQIINATTAPTSGSTITPLACAALPASGSAAINFGQVPEAYSTGIVALLSSAATCFTFTSGTITGFIMGLKQ
jgi:hypothetical protein